MSLGFAEGTLWCSQNYTASAGNQKEIELHGEEICSGNGRPQKEQRVSGGAEEGVSTRKDAPVLWYRISGTKCGRTQHSLCFALMEKMNPGCPWTRSNAYREIAMAEMWTGCARIVVS